VQRHEDINGEEVFAVIGPSGAALYTFTELRVATAEAAELNSPGPAAATKSR
jgi:hypothetical protein